MLLSYIQNVPMYYIHIKLYTAQGPYYILLRRDRAYSFFDRYARSSWWPKGNCLACDSRTTYIYTIYFYKCAHDFFFLLFHILIGLLRAYGFNNNKRRVQLNVVYIRKNMHRTTKHKGNSVCGLRATIENVYLIGLR